MNKIIIRHADDDDVEYDLHFCYAHGKAEEHINNIFNQCEFLAVPDLVGSDTPFQEGIHYADLYGKDALAFLWKANDHQRGLVVLLDDYEALTYAVQRFTNRSHVL